MVQSCVKAFLREIDLDYSVDNAFIIFAICSKNLY